MATYAPRWLQPADVKSWLRLNQQDTSDDDLLERVCAMAEPYVERCRPEWLIPGAAAAAATVGVGVFQFVPEPGAIPGPGQVTADNAILAVASWLRFSTQDQQQLDLAAAMESATGVLVQQQQDAENWAAYGVSSPPVTTEGFTELPVVFLAGAGSLESAQWQLAVSRFTDSTVPVPGTYQPDAETYQGAVMYAAREFRRRNSPAGIEMFGDVTSFVTRFDPDIDRALQTGAYARPVVS